MRTAFTSTAAIASAWRAPARAQRSAPTSNLYLGSGLFDIAATDAARLRFALATDVGGGTSFSMLRTMSEAYKVAQLQGQRLTPLRAFYLATLGGGTCAASGSTASVASRPAAKRTSSCWTCTQRRLLARRATQSQPLQRAVAVADDAGR